MDATPDSRREAVNFDVDGTLADVASIRHYVAGEKKNFQKFHKAASLVYPHREVVELAASLKRAGCVIFVVTSRKEEWRSTTTTWLRKWEIEFDHLYMRGHMDGRRDVDVKRDILALWNGEHIPFVTWPGWSD